MTFEFTYILQDTCVGMVGGTFVPPTLPTDDTPPAKRFKLTVAVVRGGRYEGVGMR